MIYGTSYFPSRSAAIRYYRDYESDAVHAVERKLAEGSIHIGKPPLKDGDKLRIIDGGLRYAVEEAPEPPCELGRARDAGFE